jgi:hypothetical protein
VKVAAPVKREPEKIKSESSNSKLAQLPKPVFTKKSKTEEKKSSEDGESEDELSD